MPLFLRILVGLLVSLPGFRLAGAAGGEEAPPAKVVYGLFSAQIFQNYMAADGKAAVKTWSEAIVKEGRMDARVDTRIYHSPQELVAAFKNGQGDAATVTIQEYLELRKHIRLGALMQSVRGGTVEYVVLVRKNQDRTLKDLRNGQLNIINNHSSGLANEWLTVLLARNGLGLPTNFFGKITPGEKLTEVVLPVFFGRADACVVSQDGFTTMADLNPQVGRQLEVICRSPKVTPALFVIRADYPADDLAKLTAAAENLHNTVQGRQMLALFQSEKLVRIQEEDLELAMTLLAEYDRAISAGNPPGTPVPKANQE